MFESSSGSSCRKLLGEFVWVDAGNVGRVWGDSVLAEFGLTLAVLAECGLTLAVLAECGLTLAVLAECGVTLAVLAECGLTLCWQLERAHLSGGYSPCTRTGGHSPCI